MFYAMSSFPSSILALGPADPPMIVHPRTERFAQTDPHAITSRVTATAEDRRRRWSRPRDRDELGI
jgi:hypothetical protein